jgi:hypothetical protein
MSDALDPPGERQPPDFDLNLQHHLDDTAISLLENCLDDFECRCDEEWEHYEEEDHFVCVCCRIRAFLARQRTSATTGSQES